jgi:hypothetical protein
MNKQRMELREPILKIINKIYEPSALIDLTFKRYDLSIKTDEKGRAILLFMGQRKDNGLIAGERYARRLKENVDGNIIKDHWEHKGKST